MTTAHSDINRLIKACKAAHLTLPQMKAAAILLAVNGVECAFEFVRYVAAEGMWPPKEATR